MIESSAMIIGCKKQSIGFFLFIALLLLPGLSACVSKSASAPVITSPGTSSNGDPAVEYPAAGGIATPSADLNTNLPPTAGAGTAEGVINPLTGQVALDGVRLGQRPVLVKVTLFPRNNRPQWGLSQADIVFEHYTEGGLSRFSAIFYGQEAEIVGPIRSARLVDIQLVRMYGALFAYGSADYRVLDQIDHSEFAERAVREFTAGCPPLCRTDPTGQNHLVTNTRDLQAFYDEQGVDLTAPNLQGMRFQEQAPEGLSEGMDLQVVYSADDFHDWIYAPEVGFYRRSQESGNGPADVVPLTDRLTSESIETANVVLLKVPHVLYARSPEIVEIQLYGEGEGLALRDGLAYEVRWVRPYPEGVLFLTFPDGEAYPFKPGTTWFELVGTHSRLEEKEQGSWQVTFDTP